jgi:cell division septal protein FtsQ
MKTKSSKKKLKLNVPRTIVFVLFIYLICCVGYDLYKQEVVHYNIEGNTLYSDAEILRTVGLTDYPPILSISRYQVKKTLESDPLISKAEVTYGWHFYINIKITENKPMFILKSSGQAVLQDGTLVDNKNYLGIPTLLNDTPVEVRNLLAERLAKVDSGILYLISEIKYDPSYDSTNKIIDENRFLLYMNDTNTVYITARKASTLNYYLTIIANNEINEAGTLYLDGDESNYTFKLYSLVVKKEEE